MPEEVVDQIATAAAEAQGNPVEAASEVAKTAQAAQEESSLLGKAPEEKKPEDGVQAPPTPAVPEKYDLKLPDGLSVDEEGLNLATPVLKKLGLTNEGVQALASEVFVPLVQKAVESARAEAVEAFNKTTSEWKAASIKELGAGYQEKLANVSKFISKFGDDEVRTVLDETRLGSHPAIVRLFKKAADAFGNDPFADGSRGAGGVKTMDEAAKSLFPTSKE